MRAAFALYRHDLRRILRERRTFALLIGTLAGSALVTTLVLHPFFEGVAALLLFGLSCAALRRAGFGGGVRRRESRKIQASAALTIRERR